MVRLESISHEYRSDILKAAVKVLDNISFSIKEQMITGFLGANGAGKTTTIKILLNLIHPQSGTVHFHSLLGRSRREIFSKIGDMPERAYFYPALTGR